MASAHILHHAFATLDGSAQDIGTLESLVDDEVMPGVMLEKACQIIAAAKDRKTVVFSFTGHGLTGPDGSFYMATGTTDPTALETTALN